MYVLCEIDRGLSNNQLNGTITTFIGQLTALTQLSVTITIVSFALSVRVHVLMTAVFVLCEIDRYLGSNKLNGTISTFIGLLTALTSLSVTITILSFAMPLFLCADNSSVCFVKHTDSSRATS